MDADAETVTAYTSRIRAAYAVLAARPGAWVGFADLRDQVGGHRQYVDAALAQLDRESGVILIPESNQKTLTSHDRDCALWHGNQWQHLIAIADTDEA